MGGWLFESMGLGARAVFRTMVALGDAGAWVAGTAFGGNTGAQEIRLTPTAGVSTMRGGVRPAMGGKRGCVRDGTGHPTYRWCHTALVAVKVAGQGIYIG